MRQQQDMCAIAPCVLGVDDWVIRKGCSYGTILVDLERHCPIDLLPGRDAEMLARWLFDHPEIEVIDRDRYNRVGLEQRPDRRPH
jgi:transposase